MTLVAFPAADPVAPVRGEPPTPRLVHRSRAMGGRLEIHVTASASGVATAEGALELVAGRVRAWAGILTRHDPVSPLVRLNGDPRSEVPVGPTLAAALAWAREAWALTGGTVDVTLLAARLRAESDAEGSGALASAGGPRAADPGPLGSWDLVPGRHGGAVVRRAPGQRFDLDGVGKGWLADRALAILRPGGALVDADGDIAVRAAAGDRWEIGVGDPRDDEAVLAVLVLAGGPLGSRTYGVATSGTSVHRWGPADAGRHHLVDPATGTPARTDVVQATVVAQTAREAEAWAKTIVIRGAAAGLDLVDRSEALGAIALLGDGRTVALPRTARYLA